MIWGFVRWAIACFLVLIAGTVFAQQCQAIFQCDGPLWSTCEGNDPLSDYSRAIVFWDVDRDGPDDGPDQTVCGGPDVACIPEDFMSNYRDFYVGGYLFTSPLFEGSYYSEIGEQVYLRIYTGDEEGIQWTSPVFTLYFDGQPTQFVNLPIDGWTCGDTDVVPPPCQPDPGYVDFRIEDGFPNETCVRTCRNGNCMILIWNEDFEVADPTRPPVIVVESGCDGMTPAADFSFNPAAFWPSGEWSTTDRGIVGQEYGYLTVRLLERPPVGEIEIFEAAREDSMVLLSWTTSSEVNLAAFDIWIAHAMGVGWPQFVATIPASNNESGDSYSLIDPVPRPIWQYRYTILMVGTDSVKYAARQFYLERAESIEEHNGAGLIPDSPQLYQNYPNPFNAVTSITFSIPSAADIGLSIHNVLGQKVKQLTTGVLSAGSHTVTFDGGSLATGVYITRLTAGKTVLQKKMLLLK